MFAGGVFFVAQMIFLESPGKIFLYRRHLHMSLRHLHVTVATVRCKFEDDFCQFQLNDKDVNDREDISPVRRF